MFLTKFSKAFAIEACQIKYNVRTIFLEFLIVNKKISIDLAQLKFFEEDQKVDAQLCSEVYEISKAFLYLYRENKKVTKSVFYLYAVKLHYHFLLTLLKMDLYIIFLLSNKYQKYTYGLLRKLLLSCLLPRDTAMGDNLSIVT